MSDEDNEDMMNDDDDENSDYSSAEFNEK